MRHILATVFATLAAALAPAAAVSMALVAWGARVALPILPLTIAFAFVVSLLHVLLFGLVASGWLLRTGKFRLAPMLFVGWVIGMVPAAIWQFPLKHGPGTSFWSGGVQKIKDGVPTWAGWLDYIELVVFAGVLGALGAAAFYFVYKSMSPNNSFKPTPLRGAA